MIDIYTAGNARQLDSTWIGAYAYAIYKDNKALLQYSCSITPATQNVSEMISVANAIHTIHTDYPNEQINIHTKSMYIIGGIEKCNKMKTNKDIWKLIYKLYDKNTMSIRHIGDNSVIDNQKHKNRMSHIESISKQKLKLVYSAHS